MLMQVLSVTYALHEYDDNIFYGLCHHCHAVSHGDVRNLTSSAAIAERDRAAGWVNYGQKWKIGTMG